MIVETLALLCIAELVVAAGKAIVSLNAPRIARRIQDARSWFQDQLTSARRSIHMITRMSFWDVFTKCRLRRSPQIRETLSRIRQRPRMQIRVPLFNQRIQTRIIWFVLTRCRIPLLLVALLLVLQCIASISLAMCVLTRIIQV